MLYRALDNLSIGVKRGELFKHTRLSERARIILTDRGIIAPVNAPPVAAIEGWEERAAELEAAGVVTIDQLIEASSIDGIEQSLLEIWKRDARQALAISKSCCGGRK